MAGIAVLSVEDDLWSLLEQTLAPAEEHDFDAIQVSGWRPRLLYFPNEMGHTVTPSIARSIAGFHNSLSRSYAYLAYGQANAQLLKQEDKTLLEIRMLVSDGSDLIESVGEDLGKLINGLISKMSGKQVFAISALLLVLYFSSIVARDWIDKAYEEKRRDADARERIELSEQETKRLALVAQALQQHPEMKPVAELAGQGREQLVRAVTSTGLAQVLGASLTGDQAKIIVAKPRETGYGRRMDGHYEVVEIDIENPDGYMGRLRNVVTNQEVSVAINRNDLAESDVEALFDALRQKTTVDAMINAWFQGDKITSAHIVRADPHSVSGAPTNPPAPTP